MPTNTCSSSLSNRLPTELLNVHLLHACRRNVRLGDRDCLTIGEVRSYPCINGSGFIPIIPLDVRTPSDPVTCITPLKAEYE